VDTTDGEKTALVTVDGPRVPFTISCNDSPKPNGPATGPGPRRLTVDKYGAAAKANGGIFSVLTFYGELEQTLIAYGTADETPTNREAAESLQQALRERGPNITVPIKADKEVTEDEIKSHHLVLIGRPDSNSLVRQFQSSLPIRFGSRSFTVRQETYAHPGSAVVVASENPSNPRFSLVVLAGLSAESTLQAPTGLMWRSRSAGEVLILPKKGNPRSLVLPAKELVKELEPAAADATKKVARPAGTR
jgi:hypothetical protein